MTSGYSNECAFKSRAATTILPHLALENGSDQLGDAEPAENDGGEAPRDDG
jgi:hypothetical protein